MKIVIDIPEELYKACYEASKITLKEKEEVDVVVDAVGNGIPLDDIKAEIEKVVCEEADDARWARGLHYSLIIIDKHTKGETNADSD